MVGGCLILFAGAGLTFAAITKSIPWLFLAGTAVAGLGFGAAWTGAYRMLTAAVAPADRAGLVDAIFIAAYLALILPAVIAGLAGPVLTALHDTALARAELRYEDHGLLPRLVIAAALQSQQPGCEPSPDRGARYHPALVWSLQQALG